MDRTCPQRTISTLCTMINASLGVPSNHFPYFAASDGTQLADPCVSFLFHESLLCHCVAN